MYGYFPYSQNRLTIFLTPLFLSSNAHISSLLPHRRESSRADIISFAQLMSSPVLFLIYYVENTIMELRRDEFPVALQAYEVRGDREEFVAEQVVNTQTEADRFMSLYAGRLIKTRDVRPVENRHYAVAHPHRSRSGMPAWIIILAVLIILFVVAYATGWLQYLMGQAGISTGK
jgi:hypothetical protein